MEFENKGVVVTGLPAFLGAGSWSSSLEREPVVYEDVQNKRLFAVRTVVTDAGMAPYMASLSVMKATTQEDYVAGLQSWGCPSVNHVYADTSNTISWRPAGAMPVRENRDGLLPVPGDGRFEWKGYHRSSDLPSEVNPSRSFVATANAMNLPLEWLNSNHAVAHEWPDSSRHDTLHQELGRNELLSLEDCTRLQCSTFSPIAARVVKAVMRLPDGRDQGKVWPLLKEWDFNLAAASAPAALFEVWLSKHLGPLLARREGASANVLPLLLPIESQNRGVARERSDG
ncbi:hypothetical protein CDO26_35325 (plasmid) [Sinorhizobium meliloti]|uniref:penicillin acylase family protein n=1 Tax=Rhizobium meliloti TaxID=382 RepID=UPI000B49C5C7|nr:penicillin acylase family protein [Sinorhizobium meliloti]ASP89471.1 hypothetical protein CDO26_35325 [Sinorhizobium meliloti]MQW30121.1 hypothetical protein [Sinorhizobium meliloti]